ncbi:MAG: hypothetical protein ACKORB_10315 [Opitutia bacterium]
MEAPSGSERPLRPAKLIAVAAYGVVSLYLVGGFVEAMEGKPGIWRNIFGGLAIDLGSEPLVTGVVMMILDIVLLVGLAVYLRSLRRQEDQEAAQGKVTQDQGRFGR